MHQTTVMEDTRSTDPYDDDTSLREYLLVLWRYWWLLLAVSVLSGAVVFFLGKMSPPVYEATVRLVVSPPKTGQVGEVVPAISVATFRAMIENQSIAAQLVKEFRLDAEPMRVTPQSFLRSALSVETPRDTNVVILRVRLASRDLPAQVANRLAELATGLAERLSQEETVHTRDYIKAQVDQSRERLEQTDTSRRRFRQEAQIEALKQDVESELWERGALLSLFVEIQTERAKLAKAEEELAKRQPTSTVRSTIDRDPALAEAARGAAGIDSRILGLEMRNEQSSRVYEEIDQQVAEIRTRLSGLERRKTELVDTRKLNSSQLAKLNLLYARESELARLDTEHELAKKVYLDVATRFEQVQLQVSGRSAQLQLLDAALTPDQPVGPRVLRNTAAAMVLAFVLVALAVLFLNAIRKA